MVNNEIVLTALNDSIDDTQRLIMNVEAINAIVCTVHSIIGSWHDGGRVFAAGNGGSFTQACHFAEELTGRFAIERRGLPAIAISDPAHITCVANDYGFEEVFSRYLQANATSKDIFLAISTSGESKNIVKAVQMAHALDMMVVGLTGQLDSFLGREANMVIHTPAKNSARQQELHIKVLHIIVDMIENQMFKNEL